MREKDDQKQAEAGEQTARNHLRNAERLHPVNQSPGEGLDQTGQQIGNPENQADSGGMKTLFQQKSRCKAKDAGCDHEKTNLVKDIAYCQISG